MSDKARGVSLDDFKEFIENTEGNVSAKDLVRGTNLDPAVTDPEYRLWHPDEASEADAKRSLLRWMFTGER